MATPEIRAAILRAAESMLGQPYKFGFQIENLEEKIPAAFDCSEFTRWCYHQGGIFLPDGSATQFQFCQPTDDPKPGDLGFFRETEEKNSGGRKVGQIYHVGLVFDDGIRIIEARGAPYNKVIFRPMAAWREFKNFAGWRQHPQL